MTPEAKPSSDDAPLHEGGGDGSVRRIISFPESRSLRRPQDNLPLALSSFVGREREMAEIKRLLTGSRLLTLTGPGGCGKTRLALEVAATLTEEFEDGAWLVELASIPEPTLVPQAVVSALRVHEAPDRPPTGTLLEHLGSKQTLLVMDNCEHLVDACSALLIALLRACPGLRVLATSREALGLVGERVWRVPSLSLPDPEHPPAPEDSKHYEAVRLFDERAAAVASGFELIPDNAPAVARLCHRLDGMPLAIELAAARVKVLSAEQILARLDDSFALLADGGRSGIPRHQTLKATMDWSHELLSEEERILFRRLSVFAGGFALESVEEVCAGRGIEREEILDLLTRLIDKSLVLVAERGREVRYRLLETVRQYAREKLDEPGEAASVRERHALFFLALAEEAEPALVGPDQGEWLKRLETEHDDLRGALGYFRENEDAGRGFRLGCALWRFWWMQGRFTEGRAQLEALLELPGASERTEARARALYVLGVLACRQADYAAGNQAEARAYQRESLEIYRELGDEPHTADVLRELGRIGIELGDWTTADSFLEESLRIEREAGSEYGVALTLNSLGWLAHFRGENAVASPLFEEARGVFRESGDDLYADICLFFLGRIATDEGDYEEARAKLTATVDDRLPHYPWAVPPLLEAFAGLEAAQGQAARALELAGAAAALRESIGVTHAPAWETDLKCRLAPAWRALSEREGATAWALGRTLTLEESIARALEEAACEESVRVPAGGLTAREIEVLELVSEGLTDSQVAERLHLSPRTVGGHLRATYRKLDVPSRTAAVRRAGELGIV